MSSVSVMVWELKILSVSVSGLLSGGANLLTPAGALIEANYFGRAGGQSLGERGAVAGAWWRCLD